MGKRKGIPILALAVLVSLHIVYALGCGGGGTTTATGGGGGGSVAVSGTLGTGYTTPHASPASASTLSVSDGVVNRVTAIPNFGGVLNANSITQAKTASVAPDGTFSLSLENDKNWVLVLEDTDAVDLTERFVGYIALKVDPTSSLLSIPFSAASATSISLGTISKSGDTGITDDTAAASDFTLTAEQLGTLARTDDLFKSVKNLVINYNETTGSFIVPVPTFEFRGIYDGMDNQFADVADYSYRSYQILVLPNMPGFTINGVCGDGEPKVSLALYPPAGESVTDREGTNIYDSENPITNDYAECSTASDDAIEANEPSPFPPEPGYGDFYASNRDASLGFPVILEFGRGGGDGLVGDVPAGYWRYEVDNVVTGQFDIAVASPWSGGFIKAVVPVLKVNRDATTGRISSIDIKWFLPNDTYTGYVELTDISVLGQLVEIAVIELENYSGERRYENEFFDPSTVTSYTPTNEWYWNGTNPGDPTLEAWGIHLSYVSGGVNLFFSNHKPSSEI